MTEYHTLRALWNQSNEKPFDTIDKNGFTYHCVGFAPKGNSIGWARDTNMPHSFSSEGSSTSKQWVLDRLKVVWREAIIQEGSCFYGEWFKNDEQNWNHIAWTGRKLEVEANE